MPTQSVMPVQSSGAGSQYQRRFEIEPDDWTGITLWVGITPGYTVGGAHQESAKVYSTMVDATTYTSASPLIVYSGTVLGSGESGVGLTQQYIITQMSLNSACVPGAKSQRTVASRWDEV